MIRTLIAGDNLKHALAKQQRWFESHGAGDKNRSPLISHAEYFDRPEKLHMAKADLTPRTR